MITTTLISEGPDLRRWFLNAELMAELDEEYRARNQLFRKSMLDKITGRATHPLGFLVDQLRARWHRSGTSGTTWDAGHVIPVKTLRKRGTVLERLAVQDRTLNRSAGAKPIGKIVEVDGVPVDLASLRQWANRHPHLTRYLDPRYVSQHQVRGWSSLTRNLLKELGMESEGSYVFVLAGPGNTWVRSARLSNTASTR